MQRLIRLLYFTNNIKMDYIKREWKKLGSISLILVGTFLIIEHIMTYGYITLGDFLGHEIFGIILIIIGVICANIKWDKKLHGTRIDYALKKLRSINN